ncbi:MAG: malate dehydrogenase [Candidatus Odinarchaeia archaeon]
MVSVAIAGTGRVGQGVAYTLMFEKYVERLILVDTAPKIAEMVKEELNHAMAAHGFEMQIEAYNHSSYIEDADLIIVPAGFPRVEGMTRRDLAGRNAQVIEDIVMNSVDKNPNANYFIITNPVDAMATLANKLIGEKRKVIGTGTNLETSRFKTILSRKLGIPSRRIEGFVGGEHGQAAIPLWSTVRVDGKPLDDYLAETNIALNKDEVLSYIKNISMEVIKGLGGTRWGPAGSFLEIIRGLILNTDKLLSFAIPRKFDEIDESVCVTVPGNIGSSNNYDLWNKLTSDEQTEIISAGKAIFKTYRSVYPVITVAK